MHSLRTLTKTPAPRFRLGAVALAAIAMTALTEPAAAQTVYLDYGDVVATGSTIQITRLPIELPGGSFIFKDVTIQLKSDSSGNLTYSPSKPAQKLSPVLNSSNLVAGNYEEPDDTSEQMTLSGPSPYGDTSITQWTLTATSGKDEVCGGPAIVYTGLPSTNPYAARLAKAKITDATYSYGVIGTDSYCGEPWYSNYLIGVKQLGPQLVIASFTSEGKDQNIPVTTLILDPA